MTGSEIQPPAAGEDRHVGDSISDSSLLMSTSTDYPPWLQRYSFVEAGDVEKQVEWLEFTLFEQGFSPVEVREIALTLERESRGDEELLSGMVDFLRLVLQLEQKETKPHIFVTKEVLMASVLHYASCVWARKIGVHRLVHKAMRTEKTQLSVYPRRSNGVNMQYLESLEIGSSAAAAPLVYSGEYEETIEAPHDGYSEEVVRIARGAARVKRSEIMAAAVVDRSRVQSPDDYAKLRGLLLSVMDDWRALGIRAVASLYRLEGILEARKEGRIEGSSEVLKEVASTARQALHVYAPLAQRLGMQRLKAKIEDKAFRILYRKQYEAAAGLYVKSGAALKAISRYLETQITQVLMSNDKLMAELDEIQVTSRVKEPYSSWKKMLKVRVKNKLGRQALPGTRGSALAMADEGLSLLDVNDAVALRVILKARKLSENESPELTRARERVLCYVVHHLIRNQWPVMDPQRIKDYIEFPKPNGYESLHYTSFVASRGIEWPFEVQVSWLV